MAAEPASPRTSGNCASTAWRVRRCRARCASPPRCMPWRGCWRAWPGRARARRWRPECPGPLPRVALAREIEDHGDRSFVHRLHLSIAIKSLPVLALTLCLGLGSRPASAARTVSDDSGRQVTVRDPPLRIVSLTPGATEMLFAAGAGGELIATVEYSDEPPAARGVLRIGG